MTIMTTCFIFWPDTFPC